MAIVGFVLFLAAQSCECPCEGEDVREFVCQPRDITINKFVPDLLPVDNADVIVNDETRMVESINFNPVDSFSIHTFKFPKDASSSGSLPNDPRFKSDFGIEYVPVAKVSMDKVGSDIPYYVAYLSRTPANEDIAGDILVEDVDLNTNPLDPVAFLKFRGSLYRIAQRTMPSESSREFCEYIEDNAIADEQTIIDTYRANLSKYGADYGIPDQYNYGIQDMVILNKNDQVVAYRNGNSWVFRSVNVNGTDYYFLTEKTRNDLITKFNGIDIVKAEEELAAELIDKENILIEAGLGDMFFYRAVNGRDFIMTVINIAEKQIGNAYRKRVSIMFNEM